MAATWLLLVVLACCCLQALGADNYTDENRPYEFGFNIEGEQHRHEKKDENGLIEGEFGFITADGVYHVTVYATDENGNFKILSMKNIRVKPYPTAPVSASKSTSFPSANSVAQAPQATATPIPSPAKSCSHCKIPTTTTQAPKLTDLAIISRDNEQFPTYPDSQNSRGRQFIPGQNQPYSPNLIQIPPTYDNQQNEYGMQSTTGQFGQQDSFGQQPGQFGPQAGQFGQQPQYSQLPGQFSQQPGSQDQFGQQPGQFGQQPEQFGQQPQFNQQPGQFSQKPSQFIQQPQYSQQAGQFDPEPLPQNQFGQQPEQLGLQPQQFGQQPGQFGGSYQPNLDTRFSQNNQPATKPMLISAQMRVVDSNTDIFKKGPGERDGLPNGLNKDDMLELLYTFNYTIGFHGHHEEGYTNGVKKGYYFVTGRNGVRTRIDYVADSDGFHPKISNEVLDLLSDEVPKAETEKDEKYGLKGYEFKWIYFPVNEQR